MSEIISLHSENTEDEANDYLLVKVYKFFTGYTDKVDTDDDVQNRKKSRYATGSFTQLRWLIWRNFVDVFKNPFEIRLRIFLAIVSWMFFDENKVNHTFIWLQFLGVLIGLLYLRMPYDQTAVQNFNSLIFLIIINTSFSNIFAVVQVWCKFKKQTMIKFSRKNIFFYRVTPKNIRYFIKNTTMLSIECHRITLQSFLLR